MPHDTPRLPQPNVNYSAHSHADLHRLAMDGNDPALAGEIAAEWRSIGTELTELAAGINEVVNGLRAGWSGAAGAGASAALTKICSFTDELASTFTATARVVEEQAAAAVAVKSAFPQEVPFDPARMLKDAATSWNPVRMVAAPFDVLAQYEKAKAAKQEAERVVQARDTALAASAALLPAFDDVPQVTTGDLGVTTTSSTTFAHTTATVNPNAVHPVTQVGTPVVGVPGVPVSPVSPVNGNPAGDSSATRTAWSASAAHLTPPGPTPADRTPPAPGSSSPVSSGAVQGMSTPRAAAGRGGGAGGGRGAGGFGPSRPGGAAGRGTFGPATPGSAAGVAPGAEGPRGGGGAPGAGRNGAPGPVGAGPAAGVGNGGEEDKEHRSNYLVPTDEYFDDNRMVVPPVIGE
ncbi:WXG100-like domain-containing protein [Lentzea chajnantorensis]